MGISRRCTGCNLLNYCIQKDLLKNLKTHHIQRKNYKGEIINSPYYSKSDSWIFEISWNNDKLEKFVGCGKSKKEAVDLTLNLAEDTIFKLI